MKRVSVAWIPRSAMHVATEASQSAYATIPVSLTPSRCATSTVVRKLPSDVQRLAIEPKPEFRANCGSPCAMWPDLKECSAPSPGVECVLYDLTVYDLTRFSTADFR